MEPSELTEENYKRINIINWALLVPIFILFAWPYYYLAEMLDMSRLVMFIGMALFAAPLSITILHGHVTMALGSLHRHHFYDWLVDHPLSYGLFFHPIITRTRFRLILILISFALLPLGYYIP
ncbi:MAG: hypothetical protein ACQETE_00140 [Bacteroidota bacterium]